MVRFEALRFRPTTLVPKRKDGTQSRQSWYPPALQWWTLAITALLCWTFIAVLQYYLRRSQTQGGVIFATTVNSLPLRRSFWYLYLPTIIAVTFSILVIWIDHDAKRYEPYRHMARPCGASAANSILLHYPFDYIPIVPIIAAKRRHWLVFWASLATVLTTFGVVPLQAGIFSTRPITRDFVQEFDTSNDFIHSSMQEQNMTFSYAQSVYGILELNETMPAFTTRNYTLRPFTTQGLIPSAGDSWTARTIMYSMGLECEKAQKAGARNETWSEEALVQVEGTNVLRNMTWSFTSEAGFKNSAGCYVSSSQQNGAVVGDLTGPRASTRFKKFSASYMGYFSPLFAAYLVEIESLQNQRWCRSRGNGTFFATFTQNNEREQDPLSNITAIFCKPVYYEQDVEATVDAITGKPQNISLSSARRNISAGVFNTTVFEETLGSGTRKLQTRQDILPMSTLPRYLEILYNTDLTPSIASPMMTTVMSVSKDRLPELLDPEKLASAYEIVYQLFFARAMADILNPNVSTSTGTKSPGSFRTQMEAVVLEPIFTYMVEGFLAVISVAAIALICIGYVGQKRRGLVDDPASLASIMSMMADNTDSLARFGDLDCASTQYFDQKLHASEFKLEKDHGIKNVALSSELQQPLLKTNEPRLSKPMRPMEFRLGTGIPFISLFVALVIALAVLFARSRPHRLSLPSNDRIVQSIVTQYLPTAIATLIEPLWIMINRLFCVLQPIEQMRGPRAAASRSITLSYGSLPPQLTLFKAARAGHYLLAAVCAMSLLANLLATAFAGLFFSATLSLPQSARFSPPFEARFVHINGSSGPPIMGNPFLTLESQRPEMSGAYQGSTGESHFLVAESNLTRHTPLPAWTDKKATYASFIGHEPVSLSTESYYQARTKYFAAEPRCKPLIFDQDYHMHLWADKMSDWKQLLNVTVTSTSGRQTTCYGTDGNMFATNYGSSSRWDAQYNGTLCRDGKVGAEIATTLQADLEATGEEKAVCRSAVAVGWIRATHQYCDGPLGMGNFRRRQILTDPNAHPVTSYPGFEDAASNNTFLMLCQPEIQVGDATVLVDKTGVLTEPARDLAPDQDQSPQALDKYFSNGAAELMSQSNLFIFRTLQPLWHNDTFASEFIHYFMNRAEGSLRLTDPNTPLPTFADVETPMNQAYSRLFAIWLGVNRELLFVPANNTTTPQVSGIVITPEERLFFVTPLFIISECILGIYVIVSLIVYLRRPGRYLARMPTSLAAVIALFASSAAVKDLRGTAHMTNKEREKYLEDLGCRYGYGSYVGGEDSVVHVGIEKMPFVQYLKEVSFVGSMAGKGVKRRGDSAASSTANSSYVNVPLDDLDTDGSRRSVSPLSDSRAQL